jgi:alkylation response protein AidB-like acyl-CoA dehydrogenase
VDLVLVAAVAHDPEQVVFALVPATARPGLRASDPLPLAVMGGTRTVALDFDDMGVAADEVAATMDAATWHRRDAGTVVDTKPATLGLLRRVIAETERLGHERDRPAAVEVAGALAAEAGPLRDRAYALKAEQGPVDERLALRGRVAELTVRAANGLVAARGGSAMLLSSHEQRWCREAAFHLVQAQTDSVRAEQLAAFGRRSVRGADWTA